MDQNFQLPNINGWLVIDKPSGIGSTNIVNLVKKKVPLTKVGHGGTLDPDATGLLPIAIGEATKTIRFTKSISKLVNLKFLFCCFVIVVIRYRLMVLLVMLGKL